MGDNKNYQAYLIRFQRSDEHSHWRVTLQNAQTGEVIQFATEQQVMSFLLKTLKRNPSESENHAGEQ